MYDKLNNHLEKTKQKYKGESQYPFFKKGSWLLERMEEHFRQTPGPGTQHDSKAVEQARKEVEDLTPEQRAKNMARLRALARQVVGDE